jgi:hypothetical protein
MAICEHLAPVEQWLAAQGFRETYRGQAWSDTCREWVSFDTVLDLPALRAQFTLGPEVVDHANLDPKSGTEQGLVCTIHHDGVIGYLPDDRP